MQVTIIDVFLGNAFQKVGIGTGKCLLPRDHLSGQIAFMSSGWLTASRRRSPLDRDLDIATSIARCQTPSIVEYDMERVAVDHQLTAKVTLLTSGYC